MPTPSTTETTTPVALASARYTTCPPEETRQDILILENGDELIGGDRIEPLRIVPAAVEAARSGIISESNTPTTIRDNDGDTRMTQDQQRSVTPEVSLRSEVERQSSNPASPMPATAIPPTLQRPETPIQKELPKYTSSYLRHGSKFVGTQESDRQVYNVSVEIKHVDMSESFVCGYLRIEGLTPDHPTLTTYFEGEIIGTKYTFLTRHPDWGSTDKVDMQHWNRFSAWKPLQRDARSRDFSFKNFAERDNLFMRWKEHFLVPDHRVRTISGASFEGFYYICFNQVEGTVTGIYFHSKSEKFQQLKLKHVDDRGCMSAMEFR